MSHITNRSRWRYPTQIAAGSATVMARPARIAPPMVVRPGHAFAGQPQPSSFVATPATAPIIRRTGPTWREAHLQRGFNIRALAGAQVMAAKLDRAQHRGTTANPSSDDMNAG
jgi:hypothetical protein